MNSRLKRRRQGAEEDTDLDMVPIMNMFLVLIPFLLMSASFFHLRAINTSVPVLAEGSNDAGAGKPKDKITVIVELKPDQINLSAVSDTVEYETLQALEKKIACGKDDEASLEALNAHLQSVKERYPASDTVIIIPDEKIVFDQIVQAMDVARKSDDLPLFPNVVLSGKVG